MKTIAAREAKNRFGTLLEDVRREPVAIERNGRRAAVILSPELYDQLTNGEHTPLTFKELIESGWTLPTIEGVPRQDGRPRSDIEAACDVP